MVACSSHTLAPLPGVRHRYRRQFGRSAIYLYALLTMVTPPQDRFKTILVIVTGLLVIGWIFDTSLPVKIALAIGLVSIFIPKAASGIEWIWFKIALVLGWINSRILLTLIFFLVLMPVAWLSRLFTRDPLALKRVPRDTLYTTRDHVYTAKDMENIW